MASTFSAHADRQYAVTTANLEARIAVHAYGTNPQDWFSWLGDRLPLAGEVLEVGAGTGQLWRRVDPRDRGISLTLTDFSAAMCEQLRKIPEAAVRQCDAGDLPFTDASFDTVLANHMLYHLDDPDLALREFARVLRPGGRVAVTVSGSDHLAEIYAIGPAIGRPDLVPTAVHNGVTAETAPDMLAQWFGGVASERYPCDLFIPAVEPVLAYLDSMADEPLTEEQRSAARDIVQTRIDADGGYQVTKHSVLITAQDRNARV